MKKAQVIVGVGIIISLLAGVIQFFCGRKDDTLRTIGGCMAFYLVSYKVGVLINSGPEQLRKEYSLPKNFPIK